MNLKEYAEQADPMVNLMKYINTIVSEEAGAVEGNPRRRDWGDSEWQEVYTYLVGQFMIHLGNDEWIRHHIAEANKQSSFEQKTKTLVDALNDHYTSQQTMVQKTSQMLGQFGITGIDIV